MHVLMLSTKPVASTGGCFGQKVELFVKIVDPFYKIVDLLNKTEVIFSKIMTF